MSVNENSGSQSLVTKLPQVGLLFWVIKLCTTAMGESVSDFSMHNLNAVLAVMVAFVVFGLALFLQLKSKTYNPWLYWFAVSMVAVFGTMAADVVHVGLGFPYLASTFIFLVALVLVFIIWKSFEGTVNFHAVNSVSREVLYWLVVIIAFALGTAAGDLTAHTFHLGFLMSALVFCLIMLMPGLLFGLTKKFATSTFWVSYIATRPVGASLADYFGVGVNRGGVGFGSGNLALILATAIILGVALEWVLLRKTRARS